MAKRYKVGGKKRRTVGSRPEDVAFDWWLEARRKRDTAKDPKIRRKYYEQADRLQYVLQDMSPLGHRMVWGSEFAKDRDD